MSPVIALHAGTVAILLLSASALVILVIIVIAPWRTIRQEPPLPEEVETRLLMGERFDEVEKDLDGGRGDEEASVSELDRGEGHE